MTYDPLIDQMEQHCRATLELIAEAKMRPVYAERDAFRDDWSVHCVATGRKPHLCKLPGLINTQELSRWLHPSPKPVPVGGLVDETFRRQFHDEITFMKKELITKAPHGCDPEEWSREQLNAAALVWAEMKKKRKQPFKKPFQTLTSESPKEPADAY